MSFNKVIEQAKQYTDSQKLADKKESVYTFNGDDTGKLSLDGFVKISDDTPDLFTLTDLFLLFSDESEEGSFPAEFLSINTWNESSVGDLQEASISEEDGTKVSLVMVQQASTIEHMPPGLYVASNESFHITRVKFEKIHPIPPNTSCPLTP